MTDGEHGSVILRENGIKYLTAENIKNGYVDISKIRYVDEGVNQRNKRAEVQNHDLLISIKGTLGEVAVAEDWLLPANMNRDVAILKPLQQSVLSPYLLSSFLMGKYGSIQSRRGGSGGVQQMITLERLRKFLIPEFSEYFNQQIEDLYLASLKSRNLSLDEYIKAEKLLLRELKLDNFQLSPDPINIKKFSDSFGISGRLDGEYYQLKYENLLDHIEEKTDWDFLKNLTTYVSNGNQPPYNSDGTVRFFSQKWINDKSIDYAFLKSEVEPMVDISFFNEPKNEPSFVGKGDILYYSVGANLGFCHNYLEDEKISVGSFINIIRADQTKINEIYLGVVLNSMIGRLQGDREKSGIAQPYIYAKSLREFKIPILPNHIQLKIASKIWEGFNLNKRSEHLLEIAKRGVEMAIEQDEKTALKFIKDNTK